MSLTFFSQAELPPQLLSGTWYVTRTSLPMWRNWDNPTISYAPLPGGLFGATRFTPAGLDICTRQPWLLPEEEQHILRELADRPEAAPFIPQLFVPHHDWHRPASTAQTEDK